jgi:2-dehydro-3-deoxyphosphogluconate aldolase/(4S)-4-hydroxy-2-oxoglutarate aldolase
MTYSLSSLFPSFSLVPVVVIDHVEDAVPLANALLEGGITAIEVTLRTPAGLKAIEQIARNVPDILIGSGTITTIAQLQDAHAAGAKFHVSPGITDKLAEYATSHHMAWLAGVANASNVMQAVQYGLTYVKFFPAALAGGVPMLKQFMSVFPHMHFCPTGGIDIGNMKDYQLLSSVFAIGGSWLTPKDAIAHKEWKKITNIAADSVAQLAA